MAEIVLVKLGGSLITDKARPRTLRRSVLQRVAKEIAAARRGPCPALLLGHGSGSFGHVAAARSRIHEGLQDASQLPGIAETQREAALLHRHVRDAMLGAGLPAWSVSPSSCMVARSGKPVRPLVGPLEQAIAAGLMPITHGDVVMDVERGVSICSTETVLLAFAAALRRRGHLLVAAYWFGNTDGIWDAGGRRIPRLDAAAARSLGDAVGGARGTDVTGGMRHRLEAVLALARVGVPSWVLDGRVEGGVSAALRGRPRGGTRIDP